MNAFLDFYIGFNFLVNFCSNINFNITINLVIKMFKDCFACIIMQYLFICLKITQSTIRAQSTCSYEIIMIMKNSKSGFLMLFFYF